MTYTQHAHLRMSQRGITAEMIEFVTRFGEIDGNRVTLDEALIQHILRHLDRLRAGLVRLMDKGGLAAVFGEDGRLVTTYAREEQRGRRRRKRRGV